LTENHTPGNPYEDDLPRTTANFAPLTPLVFLARTAEVYPEHLSVVHGQTRYTWAQTYARCRRLASALAKRGISSGDTVSIIAPNVPAIYEASFGIPMLGAVLNTINTRLDAATIAIILEHAQAKVLITDREFATTVATALAELHHPPLVIDIDDPIAPPGELLGELTYEEFLDQGDPGFDWIPPDDEWRAISSGRCRCFIATAGVSPGPSPRWPAPISVCARWRRAPYSMPSPIGA
jgi:fatty-acyl-CoA synthase